MVTILYVGVNFLLMRIINNTKTWRHLFTCIIVISACVCMGVVVIVGHFEDVLKQCNVSSFVLISNLFFIV